MLTLFNNALLQVIFALTFSVPGINAFLQGTPLTQIQAEYENAFGDRVRLLESIEQLESKHRSLSNRINELKRNDVSRMTIRLALDDLLRQSQDLSRDLEGLHTQVRALDNRLSGQRTQLSSGIERRMQDLESSLVSAEASQRPTIVGQLNALRAQRKSYAKPLPAVPSNHEMTDTLSLATQAETPDELRAAADELQDTEDQVRRRLDAIAGRLDELKQSQRLLRRARTFSKEERFFEETDRDRVIARYSRTSVTQTDTNKNGGSASPTAGATDDSGSRNANSISGNNADNDFMAGAPDPVFAPESANEMDSAAPPSEPSFDETVRDDVFETTRETVFINTNDDPQRAIAGGSSVNKGSNIDTQIDTLKSEKSRLEKQANALKKRASSLRQQADKL